MSRKSQEDLPPDLPQFITGIRLSEITGYTDVHHRQAAKKGYFSPPINGLYQTIPTLQGLFKRERDLRDKSSGSLPAKRQEKLQREIALMDMDIAERSGDLVPISDVLSRMSEATAAARQLVLSSTLTDEEKEQLMLHLQEIYRSAGKPRKNVQSAEPSPNAV